MTLKMIYAKIHHFRFLERKVLYIFINLVIYSQFKAAVASTLQCNAAVNDNSSQVHYCKSFNSNDTAQLFFRNINPKIDPCENFFEFVCGNHSAEEVENSNLINPLDATQKTTLIKTFILIIDDIHENDWIAVKKMKAFYRNCINLTLIEEEGTKPLFQILDKIGGWPILLGENWNETDFDWVKHVHKIMDEIIWPNFPLHISTDEDEEIPDKFILTVKNANTIINETFMSNGSNNSLLIAYRNYMINTAEALGAKKDKILNEIVEVINFEYNYYQITKTSEKELNKTKNENRMSIKELIQQYPSIPWLEYINKMSNPIGVFINETQILTLENPNFISDLENLINRTPKRVLANYLTWQVVHNMLSFMPNHLMRLKYNFLNGEIPDRNYMCLIHTAEVFSVSLSAAYVKKYFTREMKQDVHELAQNIKNEIKKSITTTDWIDRITRNAALQKLQTMNGHIGSIDELMEEQIVNDYYSDVHMNQGSYLESFLNVSSLIKNENSKMARLPDNKSWKKNFFESVTLMPSYAIAKNVFKIPAAILQKPFYAPDMPQYMNYGGIGVFIGHEIIHAFDNKSRHYDHNGNLNSWWQINAEKKFLEKVQCLIDKYNDFEVSDGLHVNGTLTINENIADISGFKAAYKAYNDWANRENITEPRICNLDFTPQQLFWIKAASNWCAKENVESLKLKIATDQHSPNEARVTIAFSNLKEFAEDFHCEVGSKMNPEKKCVIW